MNDTETPEPQGVVRRFLVIPHSSPAQSLWRINRVYWLVILFSGAWIFLRTRGFGGPPLRPASHAAIFGVFLLAIVNLALRTRSAARRGGYGRPNPSRAAWIFTFLDLAVVAAGLRLTGGIDSGLWLVFFVVLVAETVLEQERETWLVRGGVFLALIVATVPVPPVPGPWVLDIITRLAFLLAVSSVTRRLREGSDREQAEIATLRAELALNNQRTKLSREIHDGVGNSLAAAVLHLEVTARTLEKTGKGHEEIVDLLRDEARTLRETMTTVRDWTFFTRPWSAGPEGSPRSVAFANEAERLSRRTGLAMTLKGVEEIDRLPPETATALIVLRIVQEALTNAAKHAAGATVATVTLRRENHYLTVTIADDGCGFDAAGQNGAGVGLASMREQAEDAGGTFHAQSEAGAGTTLTLRLPVS